MKRSFTFYLSSSHICRTTKGPHRTTLVSWIFCLGLLGTYAGQARAQSTILYRWVFDGDTLASIKIPSGFKENQWKYGEGIVTTLAYPDSSFFAFQYGVDIRLPLFKSPDHLTRTTKETSRMTIRSGSLNHSRLLWCEKTFKKIPMSIGFSRVSPASFKIFNESLSTFRLTKKHR